MFCTVTTNFMGDGPFRKTSKGRKTNRSLRIKLETETHVASLWSATDIELLEPWEVEQHPYIARLGPDVADEEIEYKPVLEQIQNKKFGRRICHLLLDQSFLAGVGNYLRSEILFNAGLQPSRNSPSRQRNKSILRNLRFRPHNWPTNKRV